MKSLTETFRKIKHPAFYAFFSLLLILFTWILWGTYKADNYGFAVKTFWDWMDLLLVPAALAVAGAWFAYIQKRTELEIAEKARELNIEIALEKQRQQTLENYLDRMKNLILDRGLGLEKKPHEERFARTLTLNVIRELKKERNKQVVQFLQESELLGEKEIVNLRDTNLSEVDLRESNLKMVNFSGANLEGAKLEWSDMEWSILTGSNLTRAKLDNVDLREANLEEANLTEASIKGVILDGSNLTGADLTGAVLNDASLAECILENADLSRANLEEANLVGTDLTGTILERVNLAHACLIGVNLEYSNLEDVILVGSNLIGANLKGAKISDEQLNQSTLSSETIMPDGSRYGMIVSLAETDITDSQQSELAEDESLSQSEDEAEEIEVSSKA